MPDFIDFILNVSIWAVAKIMVIIALSIYLVFAFVVVRQVNMMTKVVSGDLSWAIKVIAWTHFFFTVFVVFMSVVIL